MTRTTLAALTAILLLATTLLTGCGGYALQGRVIRGDISAVYLVGKNDPRLTEPGIGLMGAEIHLQQDPGKLNRETLGRTSSDGDGAFSIEVDRVGAGFLDYTVGIFARRKGYEPAMSGGIGLPGPGKRVLIIMTQGTDRDLGEERENHLDTYRDFR